MPRNWSLGQNWATFPLVVSGLNRDWSCAFSCKVQTSAYDHCSSVFEWSLINALTYLLWFFSEGILSQLLCDCRRVCRTESAETVTGTTDMVSWPSVCKLFVDNLGVSAVSSLIWYGSRTRQCWALLNFMLFGSPWRLTLAFGPTPC